MTPLTYYDDKFAEIPPDVLEKALVVLERHLGIGTYRNEFRRSYDFEGRIDWFIKRYGHFSLGMRIRNLFRTEGLTDDLLVDKNWDDSYIQVLERWIGVR